MNLRSKQSKQAIVSSNHVVVRWVMGCARSSGIDEGLQDNVDALLVQSLLHACNIAPGASCRELPLDQELRARGERVVTGKAGAPPRPSTLSARLARQKPSRAVDVSLGGVFLISRRVGGPGGQRWRAGGKKQKQENRGGRGARRSTHPPTMGVNTTYQG